MEYINVERNTYDGNDCDEKCYYGIIYDDCGRVILYDVIFGKANALRHYRNLEVNIPKDKEELVEYPRHCYSLIKISARLGERFILDCANELCVSQIVTLKLTPFGELYGDATVMGGVND